MPVSATEADQAVFAWGAVVQDGGADHDDRPVLGDRDVRVGVPSACWLQRDARWEQGGERRPVDSAGGVRGGVRGGEAVAAECVAEALQTARVYCHPVKRLACCRASCLHANNGRRVCSGGRCVRGSLMASGHGATRGDALHGGPPAGWGARGGSKSELL